MDQFCLDVVKRLPLAQAVLRLLEWTCRSDFLEDVFAGFRGRAYEKEIAFPTLVQMVSDALLQHHGSGRKSFQRAEEDGELTATLRAVYAKLSRVPLSLSIGFLSEASARLRQVFPASVAGRQVPSSLAEFEIQFHDGKTIKHVAKRLKVLQKMKGKVIGGRLVVTQSFSTNMAVAMGASEDGESGEQPLVPDVLEQTGRLIPGIKLNVADRQYCDLIQAERFTKGGNHFLVRWNRKVKFYRDPDCEPRTGTDRYGRKYTEDWGWIGAPSDPRRRRVRRIHLHRPGKQEDVILLTDLEDADKYPADDLLEVYLHRWGIERMFQQVTEVFNLKTLIGSSPRATVFQAAFCLLLYNIIQVVRAYIAEPEQRAVNSISSEQLFYDIHRQLTAWSELITTRTTVKLLSTGWTAARVSRHLRKLLHGQWSDRWVKSPSNTHKSLPPQREVYPEGGHISVYRAMQEASAGRR
jgi:hypothetical protein